MAQVRVGVWGVGIMGERHARVFSCEPQAQLLTVYDQDAERARQVAARYGAKAVSSKEALLEGVDAVSIATPTPHHFDHVKTCLSAGKHVLVEKAITEHVDEAETLTRLAKDVGKLLMVGHIERYNPVFLELKRLIAESGEVPFSLLFRRLSCFSTSSQVVDVVLDLMIHDVDLALDLCRGRPVSHVDGVGRIVHTQEIDHAVAQLSFVDGPIVSLHASRVTELKVRAIEVTMPSVFVVADLLRKEIQCYRDSRAAYAVQPQGDGVVSQQRTQVEQVQVPSVEPLALELRDFVSAIRKGSKPRVTAEQATEALRLTWALRNQMVDKLGQAEHLSSACAGETGACRAGASGCGEVP